MSDDRGHLQRPPAAPAEPPETPCDELADLLGNGHALGHAQDIAVAERSHGLDNHERVAIAQPPHLLVESSQRRVGARRRQRPDERRRLRAGQRAQRELDDAGLTGQLDGPLPHLARVHRLVAAGCRDEHHWPFADAASDVR